MIKKLQKKIYHLLRRSEKITNTDMVYLAKGSIWLSIGQFASVLFFFLLSLSFANFVPKEIYGEYKFIVSMVAILSIPTLGGMSTSVIQAVARGIEGDLIKVLKTKIKWGMFGALGSLCFALYYYLQGNSHLSLVFVVVTAFIPLVGSFAIYKAYLEGKKRFDKTTTYGILTNIFSIGSLIAAILLTNNIYLILFAAYIPRNLAGLYFFRKTLKSLPPNTKTDTETISYGKYLSFIGIIAKISNELDKILLWTFLGPIQVALYSFARAPIDMASGFIYNNILTLATPKLSKNPLEDIKRGMPKKIILSFAIVIFLIIFYNIIASLAYTIVYPEYMNAVSFSRFYSLALLFLPTSLMGSALIAKMKKKEVTMIKIISPIVRIIALLIFTPLYGIAGAIGAILIAGFFNVGLVTYLFKKS